MPMCATDCPWMYVADGQCDRVCYNRDCQMDGGDCENGEVTVIYETVFVLINLFSKNAFHDDVITPVSKEIIQAEYLEEENDAFQQKPQKMSFSSPINSTSVLNRSLLLNDSKNVNIIPDKTVPNNFLSRNISENLTQVVSEHNKRIMLLDKMNRKKSNRRKSLTSFNSTLIDKVRKTSFDAYGSSLQHTNRILNIKYGFTARQVPAHAPILIDQNVMNDLQSTFKKNLRELRGIGLEVQMMCSFHSVIIIT